MRGNLLILVNLCKYDFSIYILQDQGGKFGSVEDMKKQREI